MSWVSRSHTPRCACLCCQLVMCGAFYPNYFEQVASDDVNADREISGYNPSTTVMVCLYSSHLCLSVCLLIVSQSSCYYHSEYECSLMAAVSWNVFALELKCCLQVLRDKFDFCNKQPHLFVLLYRAQIALTTAITVTVVLMCHNYRAVSISRSTSLTWMGDFLRTLLGIRFDQTDERTDRWNLS